MRINKDLQEKANDSERLGLISEFSDKGEIDGIKAIAEITQ